MNPAKLAVFFDIIYPEGNPLHTVFISMKYRLHLIYISLSMVYFLYHKVSYSLSRGGGPTSGRVFLASSNGWVRHKNRKLLAKDLIEKGPFLLKPSPPLRFSQKARSFPFLLFGTKDRWKEVGVMPKFDPSEGR
jgi:hypothetical protein